MVSDAEVNSLAEGEVRFVSWCNGIRGSLCSLPLLLHVDGAHGRL